MGKKKHSYFIGFYLTYPGDGKDAGRIKKVYEEPLKYDQVESIENELFEDIRKDIPQLCSVTIFSIYKLENES